MSTEEELDKKDDDDAPEELPQGDDDDSSSSSSEEAAVDARPRGTGSVSASEAPKNGKTALATTSESSDSEEEVEEEDEGAPAQLGSSRFVYAAYFGGAIAIAFLFSKAGNYAWTRLSQWKPTLGEPHDEILMPISAVIGGVAAIYYWKRTRARQLVEEVADELSKVTWPSKEEVTNGTAVVLVTTALATIFFALMDRFWGFVTNLVYGS